MRTVFDHAITGWAAGGTLRAAKGTNPATVRSAIKLQAKLEKPDSITTQFFVDNRAVIHPVHPLAEIISLVNGNAIRRVISVTDGASITTRGENINVSVSDYTISNASFDYGITISSTIGVKAGFKQPPTLFPLVYRETFAGDDIDINTSIVVPATSQFFVPVPDNCGVNSVLVTAGSNDNSVLADEAIQVRMLAGATNPVNFYDPRYWDWVPVPPTVRSIGLRNQSAVNVTFNVSFGIDG